MGGKAEGTSHTLSSIFIMKPRRGKNETADVVVWGSRGMLNED